MYDFLDIQNTIAWISFVVPWQLRVKLTLEM